MSFNMTNKDSKTFIKRINNSLLLSAISCSFSLETTATCGGYCRSSKKVFIFTL
ncbi:hypothetical protein M153_622000208 [Pseudoloma neurophilia]|uniref:Uncharacterized protein n=1 Tax=Pseudoloma neurophilia TaxID=146866 RepID=A0A0R0M2R3_9MICR|nr:hypothetical protein M153_622000208 [Pseudoloma neurophilia]